MPDFPGTALASGAIDGATSAASPPATPMRPEAGPPSKAMLPENTPPKESQPNARSSVMATLAEVQTAYDARQKSAPDADESDDTEDSLKKRPAAKKRGASSNSKPSTPAACKLVKVVNGKTPPKPTLCEHGSRQAFCCRGPNGGKMFSYKEKSRKQTQEETVCWLKAECKRLRAPLTPCKFLD